MPASSLNLPANQAGVVVLAPGQTLDFGAPPLPLDGERSFTVAGWFRVPESPGSATAVGESNSFSIGFSDGFLMVSLGSTSVSTEDPLIPGRWYHIGLAYSNDGSETPTAAVYVNGALIATMVGPECQAPKTAILKSGGGDVEFSVRRLSLWSASLTEEQVNRIRFASPAPEPALEAAWDFSLVPAADQSGHDRPFTFEGGAAQSIVTPGLSLVGDGWATGTLGSMDLSQSPFTIQTWVRFGAIPQGTQWIVSIGSSGGPLVGINVAPSPDPTMGNAMVMFALGDHSGGKIVTLDQAGWTNIAGTYDPATGQFVLYLNGVLTCQSGAPLFIGSPVDATVTMGSAPGGGDGFQGLIQNVAVWPAVLSADEIQENLYPGIHGSNLPKALFDFTIAPSHELIAGNLLDLCGSARLVEVLLPAASVSPEAQAQTEARRTAARLQRDQARAARLAGYQPGPLPPIDPALFSPEKVDQMMDGILASFPNGFTDEQKQQIREAFESVFSQARSGALPQAGWFLTERIGDEFVTFFRGPDGSAEAVSVSDANSNTECVNWLIDMTSTAIFGILAVLNAPVTPGVVDNAIKALFANSRVAQGIANMLVDTAAGTLEASVCVELLKVIYDTDYLTTFVKDILSDLSWWDFAWMVAELIVELVALFFPGAELALMLIRLAATVFALGMIAATCPVGCPTSLITP